MTAENSQTPAAVVAGLPPAKSLRVFLIPFLILTTTAVGLVAIVGIALRPDKMRHDGSVAVAAGGAVDPDIGRQLFAASCSTCHGPSGRGRPEGVPLTGSAFLAHTGDAALITFLRTGRRSNDRATLTGRVMPPRGGNPQLSDDDLADIVGYLRSFRVVASAN